MKKMIYVILMVFMSVLIFGCANQQQEQALENETDVVIEEVVPEAEPEEADLNYYTSNNVEPGYYVPEVFPYIAFIIPDGYEIYEEETDALDLDYAFYWIILYNPQKDTYIEVSYAPLFEADDSGWGNETDADYIFTKATTSDYVIYSTSHQYYVLPNDYNNIKGGLLVDFDCFFIFFVLGDDVKSQNMNRDEDAAMELATSLLPSKLTKEEYNANFIPWTE